MQPKLSDASRRKVFRRAAATIADPGLRAMVMGSPYKALVGNPRRAVGFVWTRIGPVPAPESDPPIVGVMVANMLKVLRDNYSVILVAPDRPSRDRALALLKAALDDERPMVLS